jgi:hypothetical protein
MVMDTEQTSDIHLVLRLRIHGVALFSEIHGVVYREMDRKFVFCPSEIKRNCSDYVQ